MIQFDEHIFQMGWFNHHLPETNSSPLKKRPGPKMKVVSQPSSFRCKLAVSLGEGIIMASQPTLPNVPFPRNMALIACLIKGNQWLTWDDSWDIRDIHGKSQQFLLFFWRALKPQRCHTSRTSLCFFEK